MAISTTVGPINPQDAKEAAQAGIPAFVYVVFNGLITKNLRNGRAVVYQDDVIDSLTQYLPEGKDGGHIFTQGWLEVEDSYRKVGWKVSYDKPISWGGEDFRAHFIFSK